MRIIFFLVFFISFTFPVISAQIEYKPIDSAEKVSYPKIDKIEKIIFGTTNESFDIKHRLNIIEKKLFNRVYDKKDFSQRIENILAKLPQEDVFNIDIMEFSQIENKILGKIYKNEDLQKRLERLEKKVFGAVQYGDIEQRYTTLKTASMYYSGSTQPIFSEPVYKTPNFSYSQPQYIQPNINSSGTFWGDIKKSLSNWVNNYGYMTGYTPPLSTYSFTTSPFNFYPQNINPYYYHHNNFHPNYNYSSPSYRLRNNFRKFYH